MHRYQNPLIVVADAEHARLIRTSPEYVLHTERHFDSAAAHRRSSDLGSDRPGASYHSDSSAHHGLAPRHDLHDQQKSAFARFLAEQLNAMPAQSFDGLVLCAPSHCLQDMLDGLHAEVRAKLAGSLAKDLVKIPDDQLWQHLQAFLPEPAPLRQKRR